jgi:hypothetical protein
LNTRRAQAAYILPKLLPHKAYASLGQDIVLLLSVDREAHVATSAGIRDEITK